MFTGITQELVTVQQRTLVEQPQRLLTITISLPQQEHYGIGDSIMLNGICSTVVRIDDKSLVVEFMAESMNITTVSDWRVGDTLNCEAPATLQTKLSGSLVTGHVDTVGTVVEYQDLQDSTILTVRFPASYRKFVAQKGSITINGVNLTAVNPTEFENLPSDNTASVSVHLIPHTRDNTNLHNAKAGSHVNLEFDYIAKLIIGSAKFMNV